MAAESLADRLRHRIEQSGPLPVSAFVEAALYDPVGGFYAGSAGTGRAGRRGDFLTAPEVGPLFGAVIARAVDAWWVELGRPDPFPVLEWGAGPGTLARSVLDAEPEVLGSGALRWCAIERSSAQRRTHPEHPFVISAPSVGAAREAAGLGSEPVRGVVLANELLDNLPFDIFEWTGSTWVERRVAVVAGGGFETVVTPADETVASAVGALVPDPAPGVTIPWQAAARSWVAQAVAELVEGRLVVFDYGATTAELAARGGWLRTYRDHDDRADWLEAPGSCDITTDVALDQVQLDWPAHTERSQAEFLRAHGIDELVDEGRRRWRTTAHVGDLAALKARSRVREAEALLDPAGMGGFRVIEWVVGPTLCAPRGTDDPGRDPGPK